MFTLHFKLLVAVFSKIAFTTALCTALVATRWYFHGFLLRVIEWLQFLSYHSPTIVLALVFLAILIFQRFLYQTQRFGNKWELEHLHESNENKSNTNFMKNTSSWKSGEFDTILDFVLREVSGHIFASQKVPDVNKTFEVPMPLGFGPRECRFSATEGYAQNVNSVHRRGPVTVAQRADGALVLSAAVGLRLVSVKYRRYAAHVDMGILPPIYVTGELMGVLSPLLLRVEVLLTPAFSAELRCLRVENMGPLQADITGLGEWGFTWPSIQKDVLPSVQTHLQQQVVERVEPVLRKGLWKLSCLMAAIPKFRLLPESDGSLRVYGALEMEPSTKLTPTMIAVGGGLAGVGGIALLGMGLHALFGSSRTRSDDEDD